MHLYKLKIDIETDLRRCVFPFLILFAFGGLHSHFVWCKRGSITYRHDIIHFDADDFGEFRDGLFLYLKFLLFCERLCEDVVAGTVYTRVKQKYTKVMKCDLGQLSSFSMLLVQLSFVCRQLCICYGDFITLSSSIMSVWRDWQYSLMACRALYEMLINRLFGTDKFATVPKSSSNETARFCPNDSTKTMKSLQCNQQLAHRSPGHQGILPIPPHGHDG
ncbi:unnamed protein product [Albugo candida]|uniref:Uncharacterized protein n=1 Tax=Albugo candida TaxID=65357 RepID=A0A024GDJ0_9STRA|nr:unnamed protein product [Albugo candida]|eukprot:CCI44906.1 unnamed protein product [Albugo candida]